MDIPILLRNWKLPIRSVAAMAASALIENADLVALAAGLFAGGGKRNQSPRE